MLYTCTEVLLTSECAALFDDEIRNSAEKDKIIERNPGLLALTTMYGSLYGIIMDEYKDSPDGESIQFSKLFIRDLNLSEKSKEYSYTLEYDSQNVGTNYSGIVITERKQGESIYVTTDIMRQPLDVVRQMNLEDYSAFIEQKKRAGERYLSDLTVIAATGALTPICPEAAIAINLLYEAGAGISGNTLYYSRELGGKYDERLNSEVAKAGQKAISKTVDYFKRNAAIDSQMARLGEKMQAQWFYSGGTYSVNGERRLVLVGIYDPKIIEKICKWEENGLQLLIKEEFGIKDPMKMTGDGEKIDIFYAQIDYNEDSEGKSIISEQKGNIGEKEENVDEQYKNKGEQRNSEQNGDNEQHPIEYYL